MEAYNIIMANHIRKRDFKVTLKAGELAGNFQHGINLCEEEEATPDRNSQHQP